MLLYSANSNDLDNEITNLSNQLINIIDKNTIFVCVGSDKVIFDSIGPLVGHILKQRLPNIIIYGDLKYPLNGLNISSEIQKIKTKHPNNNILAIDATISNNNIGFANLYDEPIKPGIGSFGEIGNYKLVGVIDSPDNPDIYRKNISLYHVFLLVDLITKSIIKTIEQQEN
jgi:putative sporulation protein YyaC